ncbi:MAG: RnfABCDGE type electron transport complex subunit B [Clostridia bacterium]|nr:RnfABCDGE type electron transport complex subunit B [Clostridia bacterium]
MGIEILVPVLVLVVIALICAVLLTLSSVLFGVKEDERMAAVRDCLPGANCGACGFSGCDGYAKALADGVTDNPSLCIPGGDGVAKEVGEIMGLSAGDVVEKVAYVACNGSCAPEERKYEYVGPKTCVAANMSYSGDRACTFACLGYGDCMKVCPRDAICINPEKNIAEIDPRKCIGCGLCVKTCPNGIIHLINDTSRVVVKCNNHNKGADVRKVCQNGCIACGKCVKVCPEGAITLVDNIATIDYSKCTGCGTCHDSCPVHCIHIGNFICGAHFE